MSIEEYVKTSREEMRKKFGAVGLKTDCKHLCENECTGKMECAVCVPDWKHANRQQCQCGVCYFYSPKE